MKAIVLKHELNFLCYLLIRLTLVLRWQCANLLRTMTFFTNNLETNLYACIQSERLARQDGLFLTTHKGGQVLLLAGHRFHREYGRAGRSYWRCTKRLPYSCKCNVKIINGKIYVIGASNGSMNLVISGVTSTASAFQDNGSDDDVIEVVRDVEAPIEILSDGEELELQKCNQNQQQSVIQIQNFHFTSLPSIHYAPKDDSKRQLEDPLQNTSNSYNDEQNSFESPALTLPFPVIALPPAENNEIPITDAKSPKIVDTNDESSFVNVTDLIDKANEMPEIEQNKEPVAEFLEQGIVADDKVLDDAMQKTTDIVNSTEEKGIDKSNDMIVDNKD